MDYGWPDGCLVGGCIPLAKKEKQTIRDAVEKYSIPVVGICLGHQLLADALGGEVGPGTAEVGIGEIQKTKIGKQSAFLDRIPNHAQCLQWHSAGVKCVPAGFDILMSSSVCKIQAMGFDNLIFSMQYHQEITASTVKDWSSIPEYRQSLEQGFGENAADLLHAEADKHMVAFNKTARQLYENWKAMAFSD